MSSSTPVEGTRRKEEHIQRDGGLKMSDDCLAIILQCETGAGKEMAMEKHAQSEPDSPQGDARYHLCWEKQLLKEEFGRRFERRLQKALEFCNFPFYVIDGDLNHPGCRGMTLMAVQRNNQRRNNQRTGRLGAGQLGTKSSK